MAKVKDPNKQKAKRNVPLGQLIFEIIWYTLCGLVGLWGLTYIVLGIVIDYLPITANDEGLVEANIKFTETFKLDFFSWGLIILAIAAVAAVVVLILFSGKVDRDYEKNVRRAQRMAQLDAEMDAEMAEQEVVDAEVAPVEEKPAPAEEETAPVEEAPEEVKDEE